MEAVIFFSVMFGALLSIGLVVAYFASKEGKAKNDKIRSEFLKQHE